MRERVHYQKDRRGMSLRIVQALFFPPEQPGGVSSMVPFLTERFVSLGWQAELFWLPKRLRQKGQESISWRTMMLTEAHHAPIIQKYVQTMRDYAWWANMRLREPVDLIHAHHPIAALVLKRQFPQTPMVVTLHSSYETELRLNGRIVAGGIEERFLTGLYRELEATVDRFLTVSQAFKQYVSPFVEHPDRIEVMRNGFDETRFVPISHENTTIQLLTMCRLVPAKGLDVLIDACIVLKKQGVPFVLHVIGDGPMRVDLEQRAVSGGVADDVVFYGYMLHPEQFMPFFDVFVLPSRAEAFGNVFAEAALCGLARIGTAVGGVIEQIEHGVDGELVAIDDVVALAQALRRLIVDTPYRQRLAQAGTLRARNTITLTQVVGNLNRLYRDILSTASV